MKYLLVAILLVFMPIDPGKIARINKAKKEAEMAWQAGDYKLARDKYLYLKDSLGVEDETLLLDLAHAHIMLKDSASARQLYEELTGSSKAPIRSVAYQQLGALAFQQKKYDEALDLFKQALRANPANEDARYNYELVKRLLEQQQQNKDKNQEQNQQNQQNQQNNKDQQQQNQQNQQNQQKQENQQKQDQQNKEQNQQQQQDKKQQNQQQDQKQQESDKQDQQKQQQEQANEQKQQQDKGKEQPQQDKKAQEEQSKPDEQQLPFDKEKLKEMKISEEKARMILEALQNREAQYIQQLRHKPSKKPDSSKPDW